MSLNTNNSHNQSSYSNPSFNSSGPRYNNNDVFDGYYLLRRPNQNNYSSYSEGDSYRARHISALIEDGNNNTSSNSKQWNQYNTNYWNNPSMRYQNAYQQQYYQNNNTGFIPPLPKAPHPPPPPPPF
jgi:hypothetical protein